jgi:hypothetical protein
MMDRGISYFVVPYFLIEERNNREVNIDDWYLCCCSSYSGKCDADKYDAVL